MPNDAADFDELITQSPDGDNHSSVDENTPRKKISLKVQRLLYIGGGVIAVGALVFAGTNIAVALTAESNYRTALVEEAPVTEFVSANGTIAAANRFDLAFQTDGTVAKVSVSVGDTVTAGQTLATLDESELEEAITEAEQAITDAKQTLAEHQETQASGGTSTTSSAAVTSAAASSSATTTTSSTSSPPTTNTSETGGGAGNQDSETPDPDSPPQSAELDPAVVEAMQNVTDAQTAMLTKYEEVQGLIEATNAVITTASDTCQIFLNATLTAPDAGDGEAEGSETDVEAATDAGMSLEEAQTALTACQTEITNVQAGQASISTGQQEVQDLAAALNDAVDELRQALEDSDGSGSTDPSDPSDTPGSEDPPSGSENPPSTGSPSGDGGGTQGSPSGSDSSGGGMTGGQTMTITAEQLLADQAAIDLAEAELKIAQAQLAFADITSPIDGEVVAVSLAAGDTVTAGSESAVITVIGEDGYVAETTVALTSIGKLQIGQPVEATVAATGTVYQGEVSSIGILNVSSTSTPSFDVVVFLETGDDQLLIGGSARLRIETATVEEALTVPSSAIHREESRTTVNVLRDGESVAIDVELGAVGSERTEILSGLERGEKVILADLSAAISSEDDSSGSTGLTGLGGSSNEEFGPGSFSGGGGFPGGGDFPTPPEGGFPGQ